jgi:hypothetical protein
MALTQQEVDQFHRYVSKRLGNGFAGHSLEESLAEFRAYQEELASFRAVLQESIEEARRGEYGPLDVEQMMAEIRAELAKEGITD